MKKITLLKNVLLTLSIILSSFILNSCSNDDDNNNTSTAELPITIDFSQAVGKNTNNGNFSYQQDGLNVSIENGYNVEEKGSVWLYPGILRISNIKSLKGLKKISFSWYANNTVAIATLYDEKGNIIEQKDNYTNDGTNDKYIYEGEFIFQTNLDKVSYLTIEGYEDVIYSILFE